MGPGPRGLSPVALRRLDNERIIRQRREAREDERRRAESMRQRDLERKVMEERERLEREKEKLRLEREQITTEALRLERERQRIERERIEREKAELIARARMQHLQSGSLGSAGQVSARPMSTVTSLQKRGYPDEVPSYASWDAKRSLLDPLGSSSRLPYEPLGSAGLSSVASSDIPLSRYAPDGGYDSRVGPSAYDALRVGSYDSRRAPDGGFGSAGRDVRPSRDDDRRGGSGDSRRLPSRPSGPDDWKAEARRERFANEKRELSL